MIKIYHNSRCRKSRAGYDLLKAAGYNPEVVEYLKTPLTLADFNRILSKLNVPVQNLVRTQEEYFKKQLKGKKFSEREWIQILIENPKLLRRPIIETKLRAVIGDDAENLEDFIKNLDIP
ncbi:MAG: ArsC/Spx/MgsR family protein [Bacteroidales bacterium]|nr:ArsC/Spx/MgsR family protein [Bacteroidales bacterium]